MCISETWVNCNDSRMILSTLEEVLTAQAYILFYKSVKSNMSDSPVPFVSGNSSETVGYSLKSEDTVIYKDVDSCNDNSSVTSSSSPKSSLMPKFPKVRLRKSTRSSLSSLPKLLPSYTQSASAHESCSLKTDGTEIFDSENITDLERSMISNDIVRIDPEISFIFKKNDGKRSTRGSKRLLDSCENSQSKKRGKKLSFETNIFYSKQGINTPEKQLENKLDNSNRRRTRSVKKDDNSSLLKLERYIGRSHAKDENTTAKHIKRRKSTFW